MATFRMPPPASKLPPPKAPVDFVSGGADSDVSRMIGADALVANIMMLPKIAIEAAGKEMAIILHEVIIDAQTNYVPIATGDLLDSGDSDEWTPANGATIVTMRCWFGSPNTAEQIAHGKKNTMLYALDQHENLEYRHTIGGAKYLEIPFTNMIPHMLPRLANAIGEALGMNSAFVQLAISDGPITVVDPDFGAQEPK